MSELIVKDNDLVNASYSLNLVEQRLLLLAIIEIRKKKELLEDDLIIHADSYTKNFGTHADTAYKSLKEACKDLMARQFSYQQVINGKLVTKTSRWVSEVGYATNGAFVTIRFAPALIPLITGLELRFTSYPIQDVASLSSGYAVRLYELISSFRSTGIIKAMPLKELRSKLGVAEDEYQRMHHFKARVLDLAVKQINEQHDNIKLKYKQHKTGKTITGFTFTFKHKLATKALNPARDTDTHDLFYNMTAAQICTFSSKLAALPELGSNAPIGASTADYIAIIAADLADENKQKKYHKHLSKLNFAKVKAKK